ncbi:GNAT family N-acetyltransferase [Marine Group I thaumarchaeote]|jgi:RimJ/RimL family protein N-acetyltransferase|nr:GNAT family N-acetyltransferase [Marine Group I thaumarchaeote]
MVLKPVTIDDAKFLFDLLKQREGIVNISHKSLPTWEEHVEFIKNNTYQSWDIIWVDNVRIGNIYLTDRDELGIFLDKKSQSNGYGSIAINEFMKKNGKKRYLANINPTNYKSIQFFGKHGFIHIQNTYHKKIN